MILSLSVLFLAGALTFTGCRKREKKQAEEPDTETGTASDNATAESTSEDIVSMGSEAAESGTLTQYRGNGADGVTGFLSIAPCATVSGFGTSTITVNFGTVGCVGSDGRTRTGKLFYDLSGCTPSTSVYYRNPGFKMVVTSQNYVVDQNAITINSKTIQNNTPTSIGSGTPTIGNVNLTWHVTSNITIVKPSGGGTITWTCDRTKELTNTNTAADNCYHGQTLPIDWSKAKIKLNGSASGVNAKGENYTATATNLVREFTCTPSTVYPKRHPFISGTINYVPGSRPARLFDYGSGGCDLNATVVVNGVTYAITLP